VAFPAVTDTSTGADGSALTTRSVSLPAGSGGRVYVFFDKESTGAATITTGGWTNIFGATVCTARGYLRVAYKDAPAESSITVTSESAGACWCCYRISGVHATTPEEFGSQSQTSGNDPNPPSLNPAGWDVEDTLWIAIACMDPSGPIFTGYPAGFANGITSRNTFNDNFGASMAVATLASAAASADPGAFTASFAGDYSGLTMAIRPAGFAMQTVDPDADVDAAGWGATPLWSKINDGSDATVVTDTLV
jgi:hypothetical protein